MKTMRPVITVFLLGGALVACLAPERRYEVLSRFFDGVPDPSQPVIVEQSVDGQTQEEHQGGAGTAGSQHSTHKPYADETCDVCHNPAEGFALVTPKTRLCQLCHSGTAFEGEVLHGPVAASQCYACHDPHDAEFPHLLSAPGSLACLTCHNETTFSQLREHQSEKGEECLDCHNPHAADKAYLLR
jgi:predicted CXXCH cytochrome family protein